MKIKLLPQPDSKLTDATTFVVKEIHLKINDGVLLLINNSREIHLQNDDRIAVDTQIFKIQIEKSNCIEPNSITAMPASENFCPQDITNFTNNDPLDFLNINTNSFETETPEYNSPYFPKPQNTPQLLGQKNSADNFLKKLGLKKLY